MELDNYTDGVFVYKSLDDGCGYAIIGLTNSLLKNLIIPEAFLNQPVTSIGEIVTLDFQEANDLESIYIPATILHIAPGAFRYRYCRNLSELIVDKENPKYYSKNNCIIEKETKTLIAGCKNSLIPNDGSVEIIGSDAFGECMGLEQVVIPEGITAIKDNAFADCDDLKEVYISEGVTLIEEFAFDSENLRKATLPHSLKTVHGFPFGNPEYQDTVFCYNGTEQEFKQIENCIGIVGMHARRIYYKQNEN